MNHLCAHGGVESSRAVLVLHIDINWKLVCMLSVPWNCSKFMLEKCFTSIFIVFAGSQFPLESWRTSLITILSRDGKILCYRRHWIQWQMWCTVLAVKTLALKMQTILCSAVVVFSASVVYACLHGMLVKNVWLLRQNCAYFRFVSSCLYSVQSLHYWIVWALFSLAVGASKIGQMQNWNKFLRVYILTLVHFSL